MDSWLVQCFGKLNQMAEKTDGKKDVNITQKEKERKHRENGQWNTIIERREQFFKQRLRERYRKKKQMELKEKQIKELYGE